jgi:type IV pilus assembly protein PilM
MGLGIDVGAGSVKALEIERRGGGVRVVGGGRVRWQTLEGGQDDRTAQQRALMTILARAGQGTGTVYAGATGRDVNLRFSQVPNVPATALANLVNFEVQQIKGKTGAVYCDSAVLQAEPGATELPLLVGLIRTEYADARVQFLQQCGVTPQDVVPNALALYEVFLQSPQCREGECVMLADIGAENIDVIIVEDRRLAFARNINGGGKTCTDAIAGLLRIPAAEAERAKLEVTDLNRAREGDPKADGVRQALLNSCGQIATLLNSSINFARAQTKRPLPVARILLSGGAARLPGFVRYAEEMAKLPVAAFDPFEGWDTKSTGLPKGFFEAPSDLAVAAGLALMASGKPATKLSFLPQQMREQREFTRRGAVAVAGVMLLLAACAYQAVAAMGTKSEATGRAEAARSTKRDLDLTAERADELMKERDTLRGRIDLLCREAEAGGFLMKALAAARETKPEGLWLTEVEMVPAAENEKLPRGFKVHLRGMVEDPEEGKGSLADYAAALKKHPLGVSVKSSNFQKVEGTSLFQFVLELQ